MGRHGQMRWSMARCGLAVLAAIALVGCDDPAPRRAEVPTGDGAAAPPAQPQGRPGAALLVAEDRLRAVLRAEGPLVLRAVQAYRQAQPDTLAICGQVNPSGRSDEPFLPWVAVVSFAGLIPTRMEFHIALSTPEATRVYVEMVDRCFDGGGPASPGVAIRPLPPVPAGLPRAETNPAPAIPAPALSAPEVPVPEAPAAEAPTPDLRAPVAVPAPPPAAPVAVSGAPQGMVSVTTRHPVNVRASPSAAAEVVRVVPRAAALQTFGEAPGGWLQVGEAGVAWGWLHNSLVER